MLRAEIYDRSPMRAFDDSLHGGLAAGEVGAVVGPAGVGKSALLVHIALDRIMRDERVLHVSLHDAAEHVRSFYDEIFNGIARVLKMGLEDRVALQVERHRLIHSYLNRDFSSAPLRSALDMMRDLMHFEPKCVLIDGYELDDPAELEELAALGKERNLAIWLTLGQSPRLDPNDPILKSEPFSTTVSLMPRAHGIDLKAMKVHGEWVEGLMGLELDPTTLLVCGEDLVEPISGVRVKSASDCTLYSGGAKGTECFFGELAERYGMDEVNFTFPGHSQERARGTRLLTDRELSAGDVSLLYVSRRLNRHYREESRIRSVLQTIWHQVSWADQVFVVGDIQEDQTVTGGTGWAVELARMWRKNLWVYDSAQQGWFRWVGEQWAPGVPVIESARFCGTGTRELDDHGKRAIEDLFSRSFGGA
ncbi:MAG: hypothetical protein VX519_11500 [Myxococcota bacterium]|nr:hypothetical protein [Myxococcota bacterium]